MYIRAMPGLGEIVLLLTAVGAPTPSAAGGQPRLATSQDRGRERQDALLPTRPSVPSEARRGASSRLDVEDRNRELERELESKVLEIERLNDLLAQRLRPEAAGAAERPPSAATAGGPRPAAPAPEEPARGTPRRLFVGVQPATPAPTSSSCIDADGQSTGDYWGNHCSDYMTTYGACYPSSGYYPGYIYDDDDFSADEMCCACGGGTSAPCSSADGTGMSDAYPCACGSATCTEASDASGVCNAAASTCAAPCSVTDGSDASAALPCACGQSECDGGHSWCNASTSSCLPAPCAVTDGSNASPTLPCGCGQALCDAGYSLCNAQTSTCSAAPCSVTDGSNASDAFPCACGQSVCDDPRIPICSAAASSCSADACDVANGSGPSSAYPCACGNETCTGETPGLAGWCDAGAASCARCFTPGRGSSSGAGTPCPTGPAVICPGVTFIPEYAFYNCRGVTQVTFPDSLASIGERAFQGCSKLEGAVFPGSLLGIGDYAFRGCSTLGEVVFPDSVASIGRYAFKDCDALQEVALPNGLLNIGDYAFQSCGKLELVTFGNATALIGDYAFDACTTLGEVVFPDSLLGIGRYAFRNCDALQEVVFPDSLLDVGDYAFQSCGKLERAAFGNSTVSIGEFAFDACAKLGEVVFTDSVLSIGRYAFRNCDALEEVSLPDWLAVVSDFAFAGCNKLERVTFGNSTVSIGEDAFNNCDALEEIALPDSLLSIDKDAFYDCDGLREVVLPDSLLAIGDSAFRSCGKLESVTFGSATESIGDSAFGDCGKLAGVAFPDSLLAVGDHAFEDCDDLESVAFGNASVGIGEGAFESCDGLEEVLIGDSVTSIGNRAFYQCDSLARVVIGDSVTIIGEDAFQECEDLQHVTIGNSVTTISLDAFKECYSLEEVIFGDSVSSIGEEAFEYCELLNFLAFPDSIASVGRQAFKDCPALTEATFGESLASIGDEAFEGCLALEAVTFRGSIDRAGWGDGIWTGVPLWKVTYEGAVAGGNLGWNVEDIELVVIGSSVTEIAERGFQDHVGLVEVTFGDSVTHVGRKAFESCVALERVRMSPSLVEIEPEAFAGCALLLNVTIPPAVRSIGYHAFAGCASLSCATIRASLEQQGVGEEVFAGTSLSKVTFASPSTIVADFHFRVCCPNLTDVVLEDSIQTIAESAFQGLRMREVLLSKNLTKIEPFSFQGCTELINVQMPSVVEVSFGAFKDCGRLEHVLFSDSLRVIKAAAFQNCHALQRFEVPSGRASAVNVETIGVEAFQNTYELQQMDLGTMMESIGSRAFMSSGLRAVAVPPSILSIGSNAFSQCSQLERVSLAVRDPFFQAGFAMFHECTAITEVSVDVTSAINLPNVFPAAANITSMVVANGRATKEWISFNCNALLEVAVNSHEVPADAWSSCASLRRVSFGAGVVSIGANAFYGCAALDAVAFESDGNLASIGDHAFTSCTALTSASVPSSTVEMGRAAFKDCSGLQDVRIGGPIKTIREELFMGCVNLVHVDIPNSVASIEEYAFSGCSSLNSILMTSNVSYIAPYSFEDCSSLRTVQLPSNAIISPYAFVISQQMNISVAGGTPGVIPTWSTAVFAGNFGCRDTFLPRVERDSPTLSCQCPESWLYNHISNRCEECKKHLHCAGGHLQSDAERGVVDTRVTVNTGYMTLPGDPFSVFSCVELEDDRRCEGRRAVASAGMCRHNSDYQKARCAVCENGFFGGIDGTCRSCEEANEVIPVLRGVATFALQFGVFAKVYYDSHIRVDRPRHAVISAAVEFVQVSQVILRMDVRLSPQFERMKQVFDLISISEFLEPFQFKAACFVGEGYMLSIVAQVLTPLLLVLNLAVLQLFYRLRGKSMTFDRVHNLIGFFFSALFLTLISVSLSLFYTERMPNEKVMVKAFPELEHGSPEWKEALPINLVATAVYCIPLISYVTYAVVRAPRLAATTPGFLDRFDFCFGDVRPDRWWWIMVKLSYGLMLTFAQVALPEHVRSQIYLTLYGCFVFFIAEYTFLPWEFEDGNSTSVFFKLAVIITLIVITAFPVGTADFQEDDEGVSETWSWIAIVFVVLACATAFARYLRDVIESFKPKGVEEAQAQRGFWEFRDVAMCMLLTPENQLAKRVSNFTQSDFASLQKASNTIVNLIFDSQVSGRWTQQRVMDCPRQLWDQHAQVAHILEPGRADDIVRDLQARVSLREQIVRMAGAMYADKPPRQSGGVIRSFTLAAGLDSSVTMVSEAVHERTRERLPTVGSSASATLRDRVKQAMGLARPPTMSREDFAGLLSRLRTDVSAADADRIWELLDVEESGLVPVPELTKLLSTLAPKRLVDEVVAGQDLASTAGNTNSREPSVSAQPSLQASEVAHGNRVAAALSHASYGAPKLMSSAGARAATGSSAGAGAAATGSTANTEMYDV